MVIYILLVTLITEFVLAYVLSDKIIVAPACIFIGVFIVATIDLIRNVDYWSVELHWNTFVVITGGGLLFILGACISKYVLNKVKIVVFRRKIFSKSETNLEAECVFHAITIDDWKRYLILGFNLIGLLVLYWGVTRVAGAYGGFGSLGSIISTFRYASTRTEEFSLPSFVNYTYLLMQAGGLVWLYILIKNYLASKKIDLVMLMSVVLVLCAYFLNGSRGKMLYLLISAIPLFYFCWSERRGYIGKLKGKYLVRIGLLLLVLALLFRFTANMMGRTIALNMTDHLSVNLSAPILNLDKYLQESWKAPSVWGYNTFRNFISILGSHLGIEKWQYTIDNPFRYANGHPLGNVSTTFYAFFYDFNFGGVFILSWVMGLISQLTFEKCANILYSGKKVKYVYILYAYIFSCVAFSFFSNKFYEMLATFSFIEMLVCWWLIIWFIEKFEIKR